MSGGGPDRGARARTAIGLGVCALDSVAEVLGREARDVVDGWAVLSDGWTLRLVLDHALGAMPTEDGILEGTRHVVAGISVIRTVAHVYMDGPEEVVRDALAARIWERLGVWLEVVRTGNDGYMNVRASSRATRTTRQGDDLVGRLQPYVDAGRRPSVLLVGEPGTGKTTAITEAASRLGVGRTLTVDSAVLARISVPGSGSCSTSSNLRCSSSTTSIATPTLGPCSACSTTARPVCGWPR